MNVRMTETEQRRVKSLAREARISASRYLVRLATEEQAPPSEEERAELRTLYVLLSRVASNLNQIAYRTNLAWIRGKKPEEREIEGVARGVKRLSEEIKARLRKR